MEESLNFLHLIKEQFAVKEVDIRTYSPLTLAYIGDAVFDLVIRTVVVERGNEPAVKLHRKTVQYVKAETQAAMSEVLLEELTEEEQGILRRGRNAKSYTSAKNASIADYRMATGLEALIGYLYLTGQDERLIGLIKSGLGKLHKEL